MNMVMIALRDGRRYQELLKAIRAAGAHSATILDNDGMDFLFWRGIRGAMETTSHSQGAGKTVLTMVPDALTDSVVEAAERVMVGFNGMICAWQVGHLVSFQGDARPSELTRRYA